MPIARKTAVVRLTLPGDKTGPGGEAVESRPLTREREYGVQLTIGGHLPPAGFFQSPRNDEEWREFVKRLRDCNARRNVNGDGGNRSAVSIRSFGAELYQKLANLSPKLREFLRETGTARRLVIQTFRPELHLLPGRRSMTKMESSLPQATYPLSRHGTSSRSSLSCFRRS